MKLIRASKDTLTFKLGQREKQSLVTILRLYPRIPPAHQRLSRTRQMQDQEANERLLDEALAEQRAENKKHLEALLADPRRFVESQSAWHLVLSPADVEWLLQVLNDVRVGSWVILGSPEEKLEVLSEKTAPHLLAMHLAGHFQMELLEALGGT
jgi:hypothetical protein